MTASAAEVGHDRGANAIGGLIWSWLGVGSQAVAQLVLLVVLARLLTAADFGVVSATLAVVGLGKVLTQSVVSATVVQRAELSDDHVRAAFWLALGLGALVAAVLAGAAPAIADWFDMPQVVGTTRALAAVFMVQSAALVAQALLERRQQFRRIAVLEALSYGAGFVGVGVVAGLAGAGAWAVVGAHAGQAVILSVGLLLVERHPKAPRFSRRSAADLSWVGGGYATARIFNFAALQGDNVVIGQTLGASSLGIYGRAYQLLVMPAMLFGQIVDRVLFPVMAEVQVDRERLGRDYQRAVALTVAVMAPISVLLVVLGPEVVRTVLGGGWEEVVAPLQLLAVGLLPRTAYKMSDTLARAAGRPYARARRQAVYAALVVGGAALGQNWGLTGVAVAVTVAIYANHILMAQLCLDHLGLTWRGFAGVHARAMAPALAAAAAGVPVALLGRALVLPAAAVLAAASAASVGAVALLLRRVPDLAANQDLRWLTSRLGGWRRA